MIFVGSSFLCRLPFWMWHVLLNPVYEMELLSQSQFKVHGIVVYLEIINYPRGSVLTWPCVCLISGRSVSCCKCYNFSDKISYFLPQISTHWPKSMPYPIC